MRLAPCLAAALLVLCPTTARSQTLGVEHAPSGCVVARQFPVLSARIDPTDRVARARIYFRAEGRPHWYFVEMARQGALFQGKLPRPRKGTARIQYYIEAVDTAAASTRTPEYTPTVVGSAPECSRATAVASATGGRAIVPVNSPPGAPLVPAGFEATGIVAAGAAAGAAVAATTVAAGAGGGGIGTTALVVGGVVVAGGAAAAVTLGGGDGGEGGGDGGGNCGTVTITGRTATTLTVTWSGGQPTDGKYFVDGGPVAAGSECTVVPHDLPSAIVQGLSFVITGLSPATTYAIHVHPAGTRCPTCDTGYNITETVGAAVAATLP